MENVDPISGNEIPPGSAPEEVRDDVPILASKNEYVLPADVVKYFGLDYIEKLIAKAKTGMQELQANGRIGGASSEDLPFTPEELVAHEEEMTASEPQAPIAMAEGGFISPLQNGVSGPVASSVTTQTPVQEMLLPLTRKKPSLVVPSWMEDAPAPVRQESSRKNEQSPAQQMKGFQRPMSDWETKDYTDYANTKNNTGDWLASRMMSSISPLAGMALKAATNYTDKKATGRIGEMLSSGVDPNGKPLTREEKTALTTANERMSQPKTNPVKSLLGGLISRRDKETSPAKPAKKSDDSKSTTRRNK